MTEREDTTVTTTAVSPLIRAGSGTVVDGWEAPRGTRAAGDVTVVDLSSWTKVHVRSDDAAPAKALGTPFGRISRSDDRIVVGSGPGEWLVLAAPGRGRETVDALVRDAGSSFTTVIDQTHGRALMRVHGPRTLDLLRRLTAMDLDDRFLPDGAAFRTSLARVVTDIVRDDLDGEPSYLLHCERSSGQYLAECLLAAGQDYGAALFDVGQPAWPG